MDVVDRVVVVLVRAVLHVLIHAMVDVVLDAEPIVRQNVLRHVP